MATENPDNEIVVCLKSHFIGVPGRQRPAYYERGQRIRRGLVENLRDEYWAADGDVLPTVDQLRARALGE